MADRAAIEEYYSGSAKDAVAAGLELQLPGSVFCDVDHDTQRGDNPGATPIMWRSRQGGLLQADTNRMEVLWALKDRVRTHRRDRPPSFTASEELHVAEQNQKLGDVLKALLDCGTPLGSPNLSPSGGHAEGRSSDCYLRDDAAAHDGGTPLYGKDDDGMTHRAAQGVKHGWGDGDETKAALIQAPTTVDQLQNEKSMGDFKDAHGVQASKPRRYKEKACKVLAACGLVSCFAEICVS